ncbi:MAG: IS3 family transposase [Desulfobulbaceae bacterium]|nr:MAG: IS3 family transposase [Desulfobulbaceae bacterium]
MRRLDELHLEYPFMGSRMLRDQLYWQGIAVGHKHVSTLMKRMGIEALYRKPRTSTKHPGHTTCPYLLRGMAINRANQVWALDTTYIPMARGFVYLTAVVDWASRKVLAARSPSHWNRAMRLRYCWKHLPIMAGRRLSTPIKAASLLPTSSYGRSRNRVVD